MRYDIMESHNLPLDRNPAAVYLASLPAENSRRTMLAALNEISKIFGEDWTAQSFPWFALRYQHTQAIRSKLMEQKPSTARTKISALRGVLRESWKLDLMTAEEYHKATDLKRIEGSSVPAGRALEEAELEALFSVCLNDKEGYGIRDAAIIALMAGLALRLGEVANLRRVDYKPNGDLFITKAKRQKERMLRVDNEVKLYLESWLEQRGNHHGPMFYPFDQAGNPMNRGISVSAIKKIIKNRSIEANIAHCSPHDLRRTACSRHLDIADVLTVQEIMGHSDSSTTQRYDRRGERARIKAASDYHLPYPVVK